MLALRRLPFRHKLTVVLTLTSGVAVVLACAAFATYDVLSFRSLMVDDLQALARIVGTNSAAALTFNDPKAAEEVLGALRARPTIVAADLYTPDRRPFAHYRAPGGEKRGGAAPDPGPEGARFESRHLLLTQTVTLAGEPAGIVVLRSDMRDVRQRMQRYAAAVGLVLLGCMVAAFGLSTWLQGFVSRPILELATVARAISAHKDYSARAPEQGHDEVAVLSRAFNEMLVQVQAHEAELRAAHDLLEQRVEDRTRELIKEIAQRQRAQEALRQSEEQLRQSQKMEAIGRLAGGVAHDFNNLLTAITGYSQILLMRLGADHPMRGAVENIRKASDRAAQLTRQLLAFSRKQMLEPKILDLNALVASVEGMLRRLIGENIQLVSDPAPALGRVKADPGQIEQVLFNLVVNARDAMPQGGRITLRTANLVLLPGDPRVESGLAAGEYVVLVVSDTGTGMDAETQTRIFEPFFTTKEKGKGTGLGLSTVYGIVSQSGGHIGVESARGKGASFTILLPRVEGAVEPAVTAPAEAGIGPRGAETVLLVEDEDIVRSLAADALRMHGYTVLEAAHVGDALAICRHHDGRIDLVLTDVVMPELNGKELFERLLAIRADLKVLYMSGYAESGIVHDGMLDPGTAFLPKPFTPESLAAKIREVLEGGRSTRSDGPRAASA
jgi:signal transduction histidine kinase/ActR/RegA family two-component response regulator